MDRPPPRPLVSVIVPTRDRTDKLRRCLESVYKSDYPRIEVVVVDDASKVPVGPVLAGRFPGVRFIRNSSRRFLSCSRNAGAAAASGDFLFFLDDDNVIDKDAIGGLVDSLSGERVAVSSPIIYYLAEPQKVWTSYIVRSKFPGFYTLHTDVPKAVSETFSFHNCYSDDTQVLTDEGWKLFKDVDGQRIFSLNPDTLTPEWVDYTERIEQKYQGEMVHFYSRTNDILVTPNHNMLVRRPWRNRWELLPARDIVNLSAFRFCRQVAWKGATPRTMKVGKKRLDAPDYAEFMGWWFAEGCVSRTQKNLVIISQSKAANPRKHARIRMLLERLPIAHRDVGYGTAHIIDKADGLWFYDEDFWTYLSRFGNSLTKFVPNEIKEFSPELIRIFLDAYLAGDGSSWKPERRFQDKYKTIEGGRTPAYYSTSSPRLAADIGELLIKSGAFPSYYTFRSRKSQHDCNVVWHLRSKESSFARANLNRKDRIPGLKYQFVKYEGMVYCLQLAKNHVMLTRRNGKCAWQGNSFMVKRSIFEEIHGFDCANFPMRFSEVDFAHRLHAEGYKALVNPAAKVWHDLGWSMVHIDSARAFYTERNRMIVIKKYYLKREFVFYCVCILPFVSGYYLLHHPLSSSDGRLKTASSFLRGIVSGLEFKAAPGRN